MALMTFPGARQVGASLLASAGVLGIIGGIAARPVFSNLIAGLQLALAQPIRLDDVLIVKGEWGRVEEITGTYVVLKIWDERQPDRAAAVVHREPVRELDAQQLRRSWARCSCTWTSPRRWSRCAPSSSAWCTPPPNGTGGSASCRSPTPPSARCRCASWCRPPPRARSFDLRCKVREALLAFVAREYPQHLPEVRLPQVERARVAANEDARDAAPSAGSPRDPRSGTPGR